MTVSPAAIACSSSSHCYGEAIDVPFHGTVGVRAYIDPSCLNTGGVSPAFITDEIWLVDTSHSPPYWVETGYLQNNGFNIGGLGSGQYLFWADSRPGGGFHAHGHTISTLPNEHFQISQSGATSWAVNYGPYAATSTSNSMVSYENQYGSEITTTAANGRGSWTGAGYRDAFDGNWNSGMYNPQVVVNTGQYFHWTTQYTSFTAAPAC